MAKQRWFAGWIVVLALLAFGSGNALAETGTTDRSGEKEISKEDGAAKKGDGQAKKENPKKDTSNEVIDHRRFEQLLKKYVDDKGMIDYAGLRASRSDRERLNQYIRALGKASTEGAEEAAQLAFFINAYNALVIHAVLQRWPVTNVYEEDGFFDGDRHRVAGTAMTLDGLDKEVIRKRFEDPRVNFVLVCAAKSCPRLRTTALTSENLDAELQAATEEYIPKVTRATGENTVETSQLFEWYSSEFEAAAGSLAVYLARHVKSPSLRRLLSSDTVTIRFSEYDWAINKQ